MEVDLTAVAAAAGELILWFLLLMYLTGEGSEDFTKNGMAALALTIINYSVIAGLKRFEDGWIALSGAAVIDILLLRFWTHLSWFRTFVAVAAVFGARMAYAHLMHGTLVA